MHKISVPLDWVESVSQLRMAQPADARMRELVRSRRESPLTKKEQAELDILMQYNELILRLRVEAQNCLNLYGPDANGVRIEIENGLPVMIPPEGTPPIDPETVRRLWQEEGF